MWRTLFDSVTGTSHAVGATPCQDSCRAVTIPADDDEVLAIVCADGAGSASHSHLGSRLVCDVTVELIAAHFAATAFIAPTREVVESWCHQIRIRLGESAKTENIPLREFASTCLIAIVAKDHAVFAQIGDGAIVALRADGYHAVFWPQSGEYANTTNFITSENAIAALEFARYDEPIDRVAAFTDGLERLILKFADRSVHVPFLSPLFDRLQTVERVDDLVQPLREFLGSKAVNERTDDDKTLVLAVRS